jgi:hypothetical protein
MLSPPVPQVHFPYGVGADPMSKRFRRGKSRADRQEQYLPISYSMARSPAFRSLGGSALKVWVELRSRYNGWNNGSLSLSLSEAARLLGLSKTTVCRAFDELESKGFIAMTRRGRWYGRRATEWRVTDKGTKDLLPTFDWKRWQKGLDLRAPRPSPEAELDAALAEIAGNQSKNTVS